MLLLSLVSSALAAMPVYILNSEPAGGAAGVAVGVPPAGYVLDASHFGAVAAHFVGEQQLASQEAIEAAQFVPGTFMDLRASNVIVLTDFDPAAASEELGSSRFLLTPSRDSDAGAPLEGPAALEAIAALKDQGTLLARAGAQQAELLEAIAALDARVLLLGVPEGEAPPRLGAQKTRGKSPFASFDECAASTRNCSGHGNCIKTPAGYECACAPETTNGYTTFWGGSACEKRDVSWQFNLLFWTGLAVLLTLVAGASMLFSVGSQPLPGVLNAAT